MRNPPLILIVDDDKDFCEVLAAKFKASGFDVASAYDGDEAIKRVEELMPDLVIMDVNMPRLNGVEAMVKIKGDPKTKDVKIILLTAFGDPQPEIYKNHERFARELGAVEYLLKGQDLEEIVNKSKEFLSK
ncbi:MAG TPA: response regulator [Candidatus Paceibacterota bacterium]